MTHISSGKYLTMCNKKSGGKKLKLVDNECPFAFESVEVTGLIGQYVVTLKKNEISIHVTNLLNVS